MDADLLRMVTRDSDVRNLLAANARASIDTSRPIFEADECGKTPPDLFSRISEILLTGRRSQNTR
jgi:hypothetical protein